MASKKIAKPSHSILIWPGSYKKSLVSNHISMASYDSIPRRHLIKQLPILVLSCQWWPSKSWGDEEIVISFVNPPMKSILYMLDEVYLIIEFCIFPMIELKRYILNNRSSFAFICSLECYLSYLKITKRLWSNLMLRMEPILEHLGQGANRSAYANRPASYQSQLICSTSIRYCQPVCNVPIRNREHFFSHWAPRIVTKEAIIAR